MRKLPFCLPPWSHAAALAVTASRDARHARRASRVRDARGHGECACVSGVIFVRSFLRARAARTAGDTDTFTRCGVRIKGLA